ncbi:MAG: putative transporter [Rikenellaceae bacterium]|nr:putative transporter [Rikenellaceae bacterium]
MDWLVNLFTANSIAHAVLILGLTIALGLLLGRIKFGSVSLGITWVLFVGILLSHFGLGIDPQICHFVKEFGLILFVYSIGLQVGPGFFSSLKEGGVTLNSLAVLIILLGCATCYAIHLITGEELTTMIGVLSGAVTNTPGLGAAQQTISDTIAGSADTTNRLATAYAVAYPLGVVGIIVSMLLIRYFFRIKLDREKVLAERSNAPKTVRIDLKVCNKGIIGKKIEDIAHITRSKFVVARMIRDGKQQIASGDTELRDGDILRVVISNRDVELVQSLIGESVQLDDKEWQTSSSNLEKRRILVTKSGINGKHIADLHIRESYNVTITRVVRAGIELVATHELRLQMGDVVVVVGRKNDLDQVAAILGDSVRRLDHPNLLPIFIGIFLGVLLGSIPIMLPGVPLPVKLGLAGGPLVVAILMARYGPNYKLVTFTTNSANMMIREIGISLFLAAVGLGAGEGFVSAIAGGGYWWILYGVAITMLPLLITGILARKVFKLDYFSIMGLMSGAMTDPPALAYANSVSTNDRSAVAYATVYPLTMFLRIFTAQILALIALS